MDRSQCKESFRRRPSQLGPPVVVLVPQRELCPTFKCFFVVPGGDRGRCQRTKGVVLNSRPSFRLQSLVPVPSILFPPRDFTSVCG